MPYCIESFGSRSRVSAKEIEFRYDVLRVNDATQAFALLFTIAPTTYKGLVRDNDNIKYDQEGYENWKFRVPYIPPEPAEEEDGGDGSNPFGIIDFDTTGASHHITQCLSQTAFPNGEGGDIVLSRVVGLTKEGVDGVDVSVPQMTITATKVYEPEEITSQNIYELMKLTAKINAAPFVLRGMTFLIGELLFLGVTGTSKGRTDWEMTYHFSASPNRQNIVINQTITVASKRGHDYLWVMYKVDEKNDRFVHTPDIAFVSKVYEEDDFGPVLGVL